jgi:hypothetical protein
VVQEPAAAAVTAAALLLAVATIALATAGRLAATARGGIATARGLDRGELLDRSGTGGNRNRAAAGRFAAAIAMAPLTAAALLVATAVATAAVVVAARNFTAAAVAAAEHVEQLEGAGLRRDTKHSHRQHRSNHTTLHWRLLNTGTRRETETETTDTRVAGTAGPALALGKSGRPYKLTFSDVQQP